MQIQGAFILKTRTVQELRKYGKLSASQKSPLDKCSKKKKKAKLRSGKRNATLKSGRLFAHRKNMGCILGVQCSKILKCELV